MRSLPVMRRSKEIIVLAVLFVGAAAFVLWYVADRRAKNRAAAVAVAVVHAAEPPANAPEKKPATNPVKAPPTAEARPAPVSAAPLIELPAPASPAPVTVAVDPNPIKPAPLPVFTPEPVTVQVAVPAATIPPPVDPAVELGGPNEHKTLDFTSGQAVAKDSPEDQAIIDAAVKDMDEAKKKVVFEAEKKKPAEKP
jgi:hypothetical protein